ncbi:histidine phosphatase family protein [Commensalibacter oyaizuii]|uniref:Histidine phosphatase family protein n=1 Tax=Commensalibacter oyaizuii TaxID=3043873 RepID=A0ABT6Q1Z7_9PROT|nr:histidine phosphatase family protein [Commensalibacter sp. TBRC 16381]MDI2091125.1 histidine phosphatase family protein [Commensalibacter sp. TBRC 16381]
MSKSTYQFIDNTQFLQNTTRFWFVRHAIVNSQDRSYLYGTKNVSICPDYVEQQRPIYRHLANRLPQTPHWFVTSLSRTYDTAKNIQKAGYGHQDLQIEDAFLEQNLGEWQGLPHDVAAKHYTHPPHPFWPFCAEECPPKGESMHDVEKRIAPKLEEFSTQYLGQDVIIISHGGAIRAALGYALKISLNTVLSFSIYNLSITVLESNQHHWRAISINEFPFSV